MENILDRICKFADNQFLTIGKIEREIGASKGVLSRAAAQKTDIQSKWLVVFVEKYPQISPEWLLTGRGEMLRGTPPAAQKPPQKAENPCAESAIFAELIAQRKMFESQISRLLELLENLSKKISGETTAV